MKTNIIGTSIAHALVAMKNHTAEANQHFDITPRVNTDTTWTDIAMWDLKRTFPNDEYAQIGNYTQDAIAERVSKFEPDRVITITESAKGASSFHITMDAWSPEEKKLVSLYYFADVAVLAMGPWLQSLHDFLVGYPHEDIKFPGLITQYVASDDNAFKDVRGLDVVVPGSMERPMPQLKAVFDPKFEGATRNPFTQLFRTCVRQSMVKQNEWNGLMDDYVGNIEADKREGVRAHLNNRFTATDMSWDEFKQGMEFLGIHLGNASADAVIEQRICMYDDRLHVLAPRAGSSSAARHAA